MQKFYTIYMFYTAQTLSPCRRAVGGDDAFAALEGFGDNKAEVLGEGRKDKNIAPIPDALQLVAKGGGDIFNAEAQGRRVRRGFLYLPDGSFKVFNSLQRMAAAEVEEMEVFFDRINRIYRIKIEEALDVGDFD